MLKRPFKFINNLADHPDFKEIVECVWNCVGPFSGTDLEKVKNVKMTLRKFNCRDFPNTGHKILAARKNITPRATPETRTKNLGPQVIPS